MSAGAVVMELLLSLLGWLIKAMFTAVLPFALVLGLAVLDGMVRTVALGGFGALWLLRGVLIVLDEAQARVPAPMVVKGGGSW